MFWRNILPPFQGTHVLDWKNVRLCGRGVGQHLTRQEVPCQTQVGARGESCQTCDQKV